MSAGKAEAAAARGPAGGGADMQKTGGQSGVQGDGAGGEALSAVSGGQWIVGGGDAVA